MRGSVFKRCNCRDPATKKLLGSKCPMLLPARPVGQDVQKPPTGRHVIAVAGGDALQV